MAINQLLPEAVIRMPRIPNASDWLAERLGQSPPEVHAHHGDGPPEADDLIWLVGGWYQHVGKLLADLPFGDEDRTVWGAYDLVAAVTLRSRLGALLSRTTEDVAPELRAAVDEVDQSFLDFTEEDGRGALLRLGEFDPTPEEWWWFRVPKSGPARRELDRFQQR